MTQTAVESPRESAGVLRRFGAMLYDGLIVLALIVIVTEVFLLIHGEAITVQTAGALAYVYRGALLSVFVLFFAVFWTRRGQTLGMLAWRLKVERQDRARLTWRDALVRLGGAVVSLSLLAFGYFWIWFDRDRLAWHDRWSGTHVIVLPKRRRSGSAQS